MKNLIIPPLILLLGLALVLSADKGKSKPTPKLLPIPDKLVVLTFDDGNKSDFANVPMSSRSTDLGPPSMSPRDWAFSRARKTTSRGSRFADSTRWVTRLETTPGITAMSLA